MAHRSSQSALNTTNTKWSGTASTAAAFSVNSPAHRVTRSSARLAESSPPDQVEVPRPSRKRKAPGTPNLDLREEPAQSTSPTTNVRQAKRQKVPNDTGNKGHQSLSATQGRSRAKKSVTSAAMSSNGSSSKSNDDATKSSSSSSKTTSKRSSSRNMKKGPRDVSPSNETASRRLKKRNSKKDGEANSNEDESKSHKEDQGQNKEEGGNNVPSSPDAETAEDDSFAAALFGRGAPAGLSSTLRALSGMMSGMSSRLRDILNNLKQVDNPTMQLIALEELSNLLLVSNEDNLSGQFSPDPYVKELVALMQPNPITGEENPEIMLLACRCIANLMEAMRGSVANVVYGGAVPVLCQKLLDIQYIDVAEQALSTLSKVSVDFPASIVREGGLTACLQFLDFFATGTQRTAVMTAANCCRNIPADSFPVIRDVMPILQNVLVSHDQKVVEQGSLCVTRIIDSFKRNPEKLEELADPPLLRAILGLLLPGTTNLIGASIHTEFLRVLAILARSSPKLSAELLKMNVVDTLYQILTGVSPPDETTDAALKIDSVVIMQALIHRPREQIYETLDVICELLPPAKISLPVVPGSRQNFEGTSDDSARQKTEKLRIEQRLSLLRDCKQQTRRFAMILLPTLTDAYSSTVNLSVRQKVLTAQLKILSNLETSVIEEALRPVPYASFLASILSQEDHPSLVMYALQASELLFERLRHIYQYQFYREGVVGEIKKLAERAIAVDKKDVKGQDHDILMKENTPQVTEASSNKNDVSQNLTHLDDDNNDIDNGDKIDVDENQDDEDESEDDDDDDDDDVEGDDADGSGDVDDDDDDDDDDMVVREDGEIESESSESSDEDALSPVVSSGIRTLIVLRAKDLLEKFDTEQGRELKKKANTIREDLQKLASKIEQVYSSDLVDKQGLQLFKDLAAYFDGDALESITSSELLDSGVIKFLVDILGQQNVARGNPRGDFLAAFMGSTCSGSVKSASASDTTTAFTILIQKLQDLLSRTEHFEVLTVSSSAAESRSSSTTMLSRQIRLKLTADADSEIPQSFREMIVSIHAIATFKALDDYLRPRMSLSERTGFGQRRRDMLQQLANARMAQLQNAAESGMFLPFGSDLGPPSPSVPSTNQTKSTPLPGADSKSSVHEETPAVQDAEETPKRRRSTRRSGGSIAESSDPLPPPEQRPDDKSAQLECADEKPLDDEVAPGHGRPDEELDAIVGELEEEDSDAEPDSGAVNMEFGSTGKVLARREDGTRVYTPQQSGTPVHGTSRPASIQSPLQPQTNKENSQSRQPSYAAALASTPQDWHIEFSIDGKVVPQNTTIYRAVHHNRGSTADPLGRNVWSAVHGIKFRKINGPLPASDGLGGHDETQSGNNNGLPLSLDGHPITSSILSLLGILHELNAGFEDVREALTRTGLSLYAESPASFINTKLTAKMNRQLEEPLIVASNCLPSWSEDLARAFPFLFPFETRHLFLQSTSFGYSRSIIRWQSNQEQNDDRRDRHRDDRPLMGRPQRQKVRISRSRILESAMKVMEMYGASPSVLEVEYFEEVGTGLGPTLEFYSTVSKEFSKKKLKLWRENDSNEKDIYAFGKGGLFPAPMKQESVESEAGKKLLHFFKMLGKFVARSMLDSRIIDINFSPTFFKVGPKSSAIPSIALLRSVDSDLANSLAQLQQYANMKSSIEADKNKTAEEKEKALANVTVKGARIDDLTLDFTLPGYPNIELCPNGAAINVTIDNVNEYIEKVLDLSLGSGVNQQIDAFQGGFSQVFQYSSLKAFTPNELVMLFGRVEEDWSMETLMDSVKADHGFNMDSKSVKNLLQVMSELSKHQRRDFLQFITGSPKLPIGGFKSLTPMFTVVCKASEAPYTSDDYLPSVMTCVNYLKLPDYSTQEIMKKKLQVAIKEGQGAFHLS